MLLCLLSAATHLAIRVNGIGTAWEKRIGVFLMRTTALFMADLSTKKGFASCTINKDPF